MTKFARIGLVILVMGTGIDPAFGQEVSQGLFSPSALARLVHERSDGPAGARLAQKSSSRSGQRKDSVLDGALIGAAIGGVGGSFLLVAARGGSDDFRGAMLKVAPVTALLGFGVGAWIDSWR